MGDDSGINVVLGIDLGTTNSAMAIYEGGEPEILKNEQDERTTPSVVSVEDGSIIVGQKAKNQAKKLVASQSPLVATSIVIFSRTE